MRGFGKHRKPVRKSFRNKQLTVVIVRKPNCYVLPKGGRADTDVHRYIEHFSGEDTHKLGLSSIALLKVKST